MERRIERLEKTQWQMNETLADIKSSLARVGDGVQDLQERVHPMYEDWSEKQVLRKIKRQRWKESGEKLKRLAVYLGLLSATVGIIWKVVTMIKGA